MSATVEFRGMDEVHRYLDQVPEKMFRPAKAAVGQAVLGTQRRVAANLQGGTGLTTRSGTLGRSITPEVAGTTLANLSGRVYSGVIYARPQEYGGVIRAKSAYLGVPGGPYLNIPTDNNKTAAGVMRMGAREVFSAGGYIAKSRAGNYGVFLDGKMMFILRRQVTLKPRLGLGKAAEAEVAPLMATLKDLLQSELETPA